MDWGIAYYDEQVQSAILRLPVGIQARYIHLTQRIIKFGPNLGMPHSRALGKGLFELRMKAKEGIGRAFYCLLPVRRVMMLHVFVKKSAKTPKNELKVARQRMKELQEDADT